MGKHKGFTFVEVTLFLAITALLFITIVASVQNSMVRQRFDDTVKNFFEFMQSIYAGVSNPQSMGQGNSDLAVYGKLVVFGETVDLSGNNIPTQERNSVFVYDVIANVDGNTNTYLGGLVPLNPTVYQWKKDQNGNRISNRNGVEPYYAEEYEPRWSSFIENTSGGAYVGSILIIRHPESGTINTLAMDGTALQVNEEMRDINTRVGGGSSYSASFSKILNDHLSNSASTKFKLEAVNFCVSPYELGVTGPMDRINIRLAKNARNASSVQMIDMDDTDNKCR